MKPCEEYFESIIEYAHGDGAELSSEQRAALKEHLGECEVCRKELQCTRDLLDLIRPPHSLNVPTALLQTVHSRVMKAARKTSHRKPWLLVACCAATAAMLAVTLLQPFPQRQPPARSGTANAAKHLPSEQDAAKAGSITSVISTKTATTDADGASLDTLLEVPDQPTLREQFCRSTKPDEALAALQAELERLASSPDPDKSLREVFILANEVGKEWPNTVEHAQALGLAYRCQEQLGNATKAFHCLLDYAEAMGHWRQRILIERGTDMSAAAETGAQETMRLISNEGDRYLRSKQHLLAIRYYEVLQTRWPDTDSACYAAFQTARCYSAVGNSESAIASFQHLVAEAPSSSWAIEARKHLATLYSHQRNFALASDCWLAITDVTADYQQKATAFCNAAVFTQMRGIDHYIDALKLCNRILHDYPKARCTPRVRSLIEEMTNALVNVGRDAS